jgi:DNA polymerase-1
VSSKTLYLVDISSFIFRAFYAVRPLSAPDGTPVNAVYGVVTMLHKLIQKRKPDHLVVCCDSKERNLRLDIYPEYKANRQALPEDLIPQFDLIYDYIRRYPMKTLATPGYEADDEIATLVRRYKDEPDMHVVIVTQDKDLMQLIDSSKNVIVYDAANDREIREPDVLEKFGVTPDKVVAVQSLCGDASDNVPGVEGVGPKTAAKLIQEYGSLENVFAHVDEIKGKIGEKLKRDRELALVSQRLVSLNNDVPIHADWNALGLHEPDINALREFYQRLGFKSLLKDLAASPAQAASAQTSLDFPAAATAKPAESKPEASPAGRFVLLNDEHELKKTVDSLLSKKPAYVSFDTETDSLNPHSAHLVGVSFGCDAQTAYYVPIAHTAGNNIPADVAQKELSRLLANPDLPKLAQNAKYDLIVLERHGYTVGPLSDDTMIASYLIDADTPHNLDYLSEKYLHYKTLTFTDVVPKGRTFADVDPEMAARYSAEDAWTAFCLRQALAPELKERGLGSIYSDIEIPLIPVLARMEQSGVLIDADLLTDLKKEFRGKLDLLEESIYTLAGERFNINSPKQLGEILFTKLKLPVQRKTKSGYSTDVDVLTTLAEFHELPAHLLEYRMLAKLLATYVDGLAAMIDPHTNRIHTSYNQAIAATGRLSSVEPNLQNIPIKTTEGKRIRAAFVAPPGSLLLSADYSQIELRLLAAFSKDPNLIDAYRQDQDIHTRTAAHIFGVPLAEVTPHQRMVGKTINFGVTYGQSPFGLAAQLGVPQGEAKRFIEGFYREFARVREYKEEVLREARAKGYVTTSLGRRRYFPDINSQNRNLVQNSERMAFNTIFQGSAADLIKKAMINIDAALRKRALKTRMILQVHDELVFEVPENELDTIKGFVPQMMEVAFDLEVPLKVSAKWGKNWAEAH